jgi:hypothetical protein
MSGKIVRTTNITQSAVGNKDGLWTTVFAAAVFINEDAPVENGKAAVTGKGTLQEDVLRQTLEGQPRNSESSEPLAPLPKELSKPAVENAKVPIGRKTGP